MSKGLAALKEYRSQQQGVNVHADDYLNIIEKELEVLDIIKRHPFILERLFNESDKHDDYVHDYWWGVVTDEEVEMIKEWLDNE